MVVKVGDSWGTQEALDYAKSVVNNNSKATLQDINKQYPDINFSMDIAPFSQQGDMLFISKAGYECTKNLSSINSMNYFNEFEKQVSQVFEKQGKTDGVKSGTFEHQVNRMAAAYNKMKNNIEQKYADKEHETEYYVTDSGKTEVLTKETEMDMLDKAYESYSTFMATSTQIWSELKDFTPSVVYHKTGEQLNNKVNDNNKTVDSKDNIFSNGQENAIKNMAYNAFMSAIQKDNQTLINQNNEDYRKLRLNLNISNDDRKLLNDIWDYYANKK